jgi:hypothetical protein
MVSNGAELNPADRICFVTPVAPGTKASTGDFLASFRDCNLV